MQVKRITSQINVIVAIAIIALHFFVLVVMPLALLPASTYWGLLLIPLVFFNVTHWALIHEGVHKHLIDNQKANEYFSRTLSVLMGASFHVLRFGHLMHHKLNREWESELVEAHSFKNKIAHYLTLLGGLYVTELLVTFLLAALPRRYFISLATNVSFKDKPDIVAAWDRFIYQRGNIKMVRVDGLLMMLIYAAGFYLYGTDWLMLLLFLIGRAIVISFMDNIYHYDTAADNSEAGKDLKLPKYLAMVFLNGNYHETHHLNSHVPWWQLPETQALQGRAFDGSFIEHGLIQFKGPVLKEFD